MIQCHRWLFSLTFEECTVKIPLKTKIPLQTNSCCRHALTPYRFRRSCFGGGFLLVFFRERKLTNAQQACQEVFGGGGRAKPSRYFSDSITLSDKTCGGFPGAILAFCYAAMRECSHPGVKAFSQSAVLTQGVSGAEIGQPQ